MKKTEQITKVIASESSHSRTETFREISDARLQVRELREAHKEIAEWLQNEAEERMKQAISRRDSSQIMRNATGAELRSAKALAEKMSGHKLYRVRVTEASAKADATMQDGIAEKLETEARQLSAWADVLLSHSHPTVAPPEAVLAVEGERPADAKSNGGSR